MSLAQTKSFKERQSITQTCLCMYVFIDPWGEITFSMHLTHPN